MIVSCDDLVDWIVDREALLVAAWTPQVIEATTWEALFAAAFADELHSAMVKTMLNEGTEKQFLGLVTRSNTGLDPRTERSIAERFYDVTLNLARAASRHERDNRAEVMSFKYGVVVGDGRTDPTHLPLADVLLPRNHSFWLRWHPPFGMDCRCGTNMMTRGQFERSARSITSEAALVGCR